MQNSKITVKCPECKKNIVTTISDFKNNRYIECTECKKPIAAGEDGINEQINNFIRKKLFIYAIVLHKASAGTSLADSKLYIQGIAKTMGISVKLGLGYKGILIFSIILGIILTYAVSYFFPKVVYIISNELLGIKSRGITTLTFFVASGFYGILIFIFLAARRFFKTPRPPKTSGIKHTNYDFTKDDFRGNAS